MNRTLKATAVLMLMMVFAAGCTKSSYQGRQYVDLGLPSGALWATCNVGADAPEDYGECFAWGETESKDEFTWENYKFFEGDSIIKYNNYDGFTRLEEEDDAASVKWGSGWCMPTGEDWWELYNNTTQTWNVRNGVNGRLFTAANGRELFLPATIYPSLQGSDMIQGRYWINQGGGGVIIRYFCITSQVCKEDVITRYEGLFVRPVYYKH